MAGSNLLDRPVRDDDLFQRLSPLGVTAGGQLGDLQNERGGDGQDGTPFLCAVLCAEYCVDHEAAPSRDLLVTPVAATCYGAVRLACFQQMSDGKAARKLGGGGLQGSTHRSLPKASQAQALFIAHHGRLLPARFRSQPRKANSQRRVSALAGYLPPAPHRACGRGLWLARQFSDLAEVHSDSAGTTIRLHLTLTCPGDRAA